MLSLDVLTKLEWSQFGEDKFLGSVLRSVGLIIGSCQLLLKFCLSAYELNYSNESKLNVKSDDGVLFGEISWSKVRI